MRNSLLMLVIGLFFGTGFGFLLAQAVEMPTTAHDHASHGDPHDDRGPLPASGATDHAHAALLEAGDPAPTVRAEIEDEGGGSLNIHILTGNFRFAPDHVNTPAAPGEGHAHVYVNGVKKLRAYGPWVNIGGLPSGPAEIRVTLNANSHEALAKDGAPIEYATTVNVK